MTLELDGKTYDTDENGYLINLSEWSSDLAGQLAKLEHIDMTEKHWEIVNFLRKYYEEYQIAPAVKVLTKEIAKLNDIKRKEASTFLYDLFPKGPALQACKIAGLPKPTGCV